VKIIVAAAALLLSVAGCSLPAISRSLATTPVMRSQAEDSESRPGQSEPPPIVQVREYWRSAVVEIVAWDPDDAAFGLRTSVTRTGKLVGGVRIGDHRLYMTPFLARDMGGFVHAASMEGQLLLGTGGQQDSYACYYGKRCSPMTTVGVRVPDSLLRANRDSLVVTFFPRVMEPWTLTLRRELIAAYLEKVDRVVADLRRSGGA
jgi:hypothetical protein